MDFATEKKLKDLEKRVTCINNMLVTPAQNNMTPEREKALNAELKYCYLKQEEIYNYEIRKMESCKYNKG